MTIREITEKAIKLGAMQKPLELFSLLDLLSKDPPRVVVEIGAASGGTLQALCWVAHPEATIISIDLPGGPFGNGRSLADGKGEFFLKKGQELKLLSSDSHSKNTLKKLLKALARRKIDFLFIDGDHTYAGVKKDFGIYSPLVKEGGLIAFHDILYHPNVPECQVNRFWDEIKVRYESKESIDISDRTWGGIGLIHYSKKEKEIRTAPAAGDYGLLLQLGGLELQQGFIRLECDYESFPWPIESDAVHVCLCPHVAEHIKPWNIMAFFDELWRIVKPGGQVALSTPYAGSMGWWSDPSHCTGFNERSFAYLDPTQEAYKTHKPKPWKIEKGNPVWQCNGNLECILYPIK